MKNIILFIGLILLLTSCSNQQPLFTLKPTLTKEVGVTALTINPLALNAIVQNPKKDLTISLPVDEGQVLLNLKPLDLFSNSFQVFTDKAQQVTVNRGVFYTGKIAGEDSSQVTISIINGEIIGLVSSKKTGDLTIGKSNTDYVVALNDEPMKFECGTDNLDTKEYDKIHAKLSNVGSNVGSLATKCITEDQELTYENFVQFKTVQACTDWLTTLFAAKKTFYASEGINIAIGKVMIWTTPDGYNANTGTALTEFGQRRANDPNFTGDLIQLIRGKTGGSASGIAWVDALCMPKQYKTSVAEPYFNFASYPNYSWSVNVVCHETGHSLGSPHTHSCTWPGGPIDNCYTQEGSCNPGPTPPIGGGTMQSYCHLNGIGIRFSNGFGTLPGNLIRSRIANSCFVGTCATTVPTCSDGVKNGDETGIDCGGSCKPCAIPVDPTTNLCLGKQAFQSSEYPGYPATNATDGNINTFSHTGGATSSPWIYVDLVNSNLINKIKITNRVNCCGNRLKNIRVYVSDKPITTYSTTGFVYEYNNNAGAANGEIIDITLNATGRYICIVAKYIDFLHLAEISAYNGQIVNCKYDTFKVANPITYHDSIVKTCK